MFIVPDNNTFCFTIGIIVWADVWHTKAIFQWSVSVEIKNFTRYGFWENRDII